MMHGREKSDLAIVAGKPANKAEQSAAESVERRAGTKGNTHQQSTHWAQNQARVSQALEHIRQLAPSHTRGRSRMRESRTYGSGRGACDETRVPTATGVDGPLAASECQTAVIESAANGSHPWARLLRSDWTWRSMFFRCTGSMQRERRFCASSFGVRRFWRSSVDCRPVWLAWRRARRRTTGRGSCARLATRCD